MLPARRVLVIGASASFGADLVAGFIAQGAKVLFQMCRLKRCRSPERILAPVRRNLKCQLK